MTENQAPGDAAVSPDQVAPKARAAWQFFQQMVADVTRIVTEDAESEREFVEGPRVIARISSLCAQLSVEAGAAEWIAENDTLVSRRGHRIAFRRRGTGPTVLLLHGFPTWSYDYAEVATDLAAGQVLF